MQGNRLLKPIALYTLAILVCAGVYARWHQVHTLENARNDIVAGGVALEHARAQVYHLSASEAPLASLSASLQYARDAATHYENAQHVVSAGPAALALTATMLVQLQQAVRALPVVDQLIGYDATRDLSIDGPEHRTLLLSRLYALRQGIIHARDAIADEPSLHASLDDALAISASLIVAVDHGDSVATTAYRRTFLKTYANIVIEAEHVRSSVLASCSDL